MSGVAQSSVSELESDLGRRASPDVLRKFAGPLGVSYDSLLADAGYTPEIPMEPRDFPAWFSQMPENIRDFILEESRAGWPYIRILFDARVNKLSPEDVKKVVAILADFSKRQGK